MKISWLFVIMLLAFVAIFSVQNAGVMTVRFLAWDFTLSAALVIQLAALLGGLVGLVAGAWSRRPRPSSDLQPPRSPPANREAPPDPAP